MALQKEQGSLKGEFEKEIEGLQQDLMQAEMEIAEQKMVQLDLTQNLKMMRKISKNQGLKDQIEGGQTFLLNDPNPAAANPLKKKRRK